MMFHCFISNGNQGYSSQKSIDFLLLPFCINFVTIYLSESNFAIMYLYKEKYQGCRPCRFRQEYFFHVYPI